MFSEWDGTTWSSVAGGLTGSGVTNTIAALEAFDDGSGPALYLAGSLLSAGGNVAWGIARWSCGSTISVRATQATPGAPVFVNNANLTPSREYFNIFSVDPCPGVPGTGPLLGLCSLTSINNQFLLSQALAPVGTPLTHFLAPASYLNWGPLSLPPLTVDGVCFDFTGGVLGPVSSVARITVQ